MPQIDFLPEKYRQRDVHRKNRWSRVVVVLLFVGLLAAGAFALRKKRSAVAAELELARQGYDAMMLETTNLAKAVAQLSEVRGEANLVAYLRHPWSRARIVAAIVERWPESLILQELKVQRETGQAGRAAVFIVAPPPDQQSSKPPAQADLAELRRDLQHRPTAVLLSGLMTDHAVLHRYLAELSKVDLFSNVELLGMAPAAEGRSLRFNVRLSLAPGYGQPGGPTSPPKPRDIAANRVPATETTQRGRSKADEPAASAPSLSPSSFFAAISADGSDAEEETPDEAAEGDAQETNAADADGAPESDEGNAAAEHADEAAAEHRGEEAHEEDSP